MDLGVRIIDRLLRPMGLRATEITAARYPVEFDDADRNICRDILENKLTLTNREAVFATALACRYVCRSGIAGDFVECGVWRGGHGLIAADVFRRHDTARKVRLFDTFAGMTLPTETDIGLQDGIGAAGRFLANQTETHNEWCYASIEEVSRNFASRGFDSAMFIKGDVVETLARSENLPGSISVLRLDTDWYESTKVELEVLWPRLSLGGVLIVDDYGHWAGSKQAVDEYFSANRPLMHYIDYAVRAIVKLA